jgi:hypothetical protein
MMLHTRGNLISRIQTIFDLSSYSQHFQIHFNIHDLSILHFSCSDPLFALNAPPGLPRATLGWREHCTGTEVAFETEDGMFSL